MFQLASQFVLLVLFYREVSLFFEGEKGESGGTRNDTICASKPVDTRDTEKL